MRAPLRVLLTTLALLVFGVAAPPSASAQATVDLQARAGELTREELTVLLERLEAAASSPAYSGALREQAEREARFVRERLESGDFHVGDRVILEVAGEPQLTDTLAVTGRRALDLPQIGEISLAGVLRSELEEHLRTELSRYIREPEVRAQALIRIAVLGSVDAPGFYTMPATVLLEDAVMAAGGPAAAGDIDEIRIERGDAVLWGGEQLQEAMVEGRTLDQLSLHAGDRIIVPERQPGMFEGGLVRTLLVTIPPLVYLVSRLLQ